MIFKLESYRGNFFEKSNLTDYRSVYYQDIATRISYINDYEKVIKYMDSSGGLSPNDAVGKIRNIFEDNSEYLISLPSFINSFSDTVRSVFINEAHEISKHRILTTLLLQPLYDKGFRYLFLEAYQKNGIDGTTPLIGSGGYTSEPLFADMIRQALKIGFKILPFDTYREHITYTRNTRDSLMAINISEIYKTDTNAKILVHAGWAHIQERSTTSFNTMGNFYKSFTGINPLTIDQTSIIEVNAIPSSNRFIEWIDRYKSNISEMRIYKNNRNDMNVYDYTFLYPATKYINGRPDWLLMTDTENLVV